MLWGNTTQPYSSSKRRCSSAARPKGAEGDATLETTEALSTAYLDRHENEQVERLLLPALEIARKSRGEEDPHTLTILNNLAYAYYAEGNLDKATPLMEKVMEIRRRVSGDRDVNTFSAMNNLAMFYGRQKRFADAEALYVKALAMCREKLGDDHPHTLTSIHNLAVFYQSQHESAKAEPLFKECLQRQRRVLTPAHPWTRLTVEQMARMYFAQARYADAEPLYREVSQWLAEHPQEEPNVPRAMHPQLLILCYRGMGDDGKAREWEQKLRALLGQRIAGLSEKLAKVPSTQPVVATMLKDRGEMHQLRGDFPEAISDFQKSLERTPDSVDLADRIACMQLYIGDEAGYQATCRQMLRRFGSTTDRETADLTVQPCLLRLDLIEEQATVRRLVEVEVAPGDTKQMYWHQLSKGIAQYRAGDFDSAVDWLTRARAGFANRTAAIDLMERQVNCEIEGETSALFYLAMAEHRRGREPEARVAMAAAIQKLRADVLEISSCGWVVGRQDWVVTQLAAREAESVLNASSPANPATTPSHF